MNRYIFACILLVPLGAGCTLAPARSLEEYRMPTDVPAPSALTQTAEAEIALQIPPEACPVTTSTAPSFEAPEPYSPSAPWDEIFWFGSNGLWTALQNDGVWDGLPKTSDGYTQKIMWWSDLYDLPNEPEPALVVTGRKMDGDSPPLRFYGATNAFADDIGDAMLTGVEFPTLGCWEVKGEYKGNELTFVVWIAP